MVFRMYWLMVVGYSHRHCVSRFHRPIAQVGHMAVCTGYSGVEVGAAGAIQLVIRMASLHDGRAGAGISPIGEVDAVLVLDYVFDAHPIRPGHRQHFVCTGKEIIHVAVGTHQRAHLLARIGAQSMPSDFRAASTAGLVMTRRMVPASWHWQPIGLVMLGVMSLKRLESYATMPI